MDLKMVENEYDVDEKILEKMVSCLIDLFDEINHLLIQELYG
jgi:hypothetical protein